MKHFVGIAVLAFCFSFVASVDTAQAQCGSCGALGYAGIGGYGWLGLNGSAYDSGRVPTPPYFALHPPVYYSQPVARSYGHSPFAYPGTHVTPDPAPKAAMIQNPHVKPAKTDAEPKMDLKKLTQLEVTNPFAVSAKTKLVSLED